MKPLLFSNNWEKWLLFTIIFFCSNIDLKADGFEEYSPIEDCYSIFINQKKKNLKAYPTDAEPIPLTKRNKTIISGFFSFENTINPLVFLMENDFDKDSIPDIIDLDDDNDGIADFSEYCNPEGDWTCLPGGMNPSLDNDNDFIPNYLDSSDPDVNNDCPDLNKDGICDELNPIYDTDGDGVPDHLDLDSDNDGITDLTEAGHSQKDINGDGMIDGDPSFFGNNGLFNALASDPNDLDAFENYGRLDTDEDGVPDHDDLDSDNDGIHDVVEVGGNLLDANGDGRIDDKTGIIPMVNDAGIAHVIDPAHTELPIPLPVDTDIDGIADWRDLDSDNDGINDVAEGVKMDADNDGIIGKGKPKVDRDGKAIADTAGMALFTSSKPLNSDGLGEADYRVLDADNDGINDVNEANLSDEDNDGLLGLGKGKVNDKGQIIADRDGLALMPISNPTDGDGDQKPDFQDVDRDNDGIEDQYECPGGWPCVDTDKDSVLDVDDLDSDNDLLLDIEECPGGAPCADTDNNAVANFLEYDCNRRNTPMPIEATGGGQFCENTAVKLNVSGDPNFSDTVQIKWTGPNDFEFTDIAKADDNFSLKVLDTRTNSSGIYALVLETERGCKSEPVKIQVDFKAKPEAPNLMVAKNEFCTGDELKLEVNTFSGNEVNYIWFQQVNGEHVVIDTTTVSTLIIDNIQDSNAGLYTVMASVNNCESSISNAQLIRVKEPIDAPTATSSASILNPACEGESVRLSLPTQEGATYEWTGPNGVVATTANHLFPEASYLINGTYNALVTFGGCSVRTNDVTVMVNQKPNTPVLGEVLSKQCEGQATSLKIIEPVNFPNNESLRFDWYNIGDNSPIHTTSSPSLEFSELSDTNNGDYYVEVSLLGCTSDASNVQTIEVQPAVNVAVSTSAAKESPACEGDLVTLTGTLFNDATYQWFGPNGFTSDQPSASFPNANELVNGVYTLVVTINNCPSTSEPLELVVQPKPAAPVIALDNLEPCVGENVTIKVVNNLNIEEDNKVSVDWYKEATQEIVESTTGLVWNLNNLENIDDGAYYGILNIDGCASERSNTQEISTQPGLEEIFIQSNADATISPVCEGDQVQLTVPFEEAVQYQWHGPNGLMEENSNSLIFEAASLQENGKYYVVREKKGCTRKSEAIEIKINKKHNTPDLMVVEGPQCYKGDVTFRINNPQEIPGGSEVLYSWYHVQTSQLVGTSTHPIYTLTNLTEANNGTYYAVLTVDGCNTSPSNVGQVLVQEPHVDLTATASVGIDKPACEGENVKLNVPLVIGATYEWYGPNGFSSDKPNPVIDAINASESGEYYAVVTNNACPIITNRLKIKVEKRPAAPILMADEGQKCEGETLELSISNAYQFEQATATYNWFDALTNTHIETTQLPLLNRTDLNKDIAFYAQVEQQNCKSEISNKIEIEVDKAPIETAFILDDFSNSCRETEMKIEAIQPLLGTGEWSSSSNASFVNPLNPATILLNLKSGNNTIYWTLSYKGCEDYSKDSILIHHEETIIEAMDDEFTIEFNGTLEQADLIQNDLLSKEGQYDVKLMSRPVFGLLSFDNGKAAYEPDENFFGTDEFEYEICNANCPDICDRAMVRVKVVDDASKKPCFIPNVITPNGDGRNDYLRIPCVESQSDSQLKIFNRWGDLVYETDTYKNDWDGSYNGKTLPNGTYFYIFSMEKSGIEPLQGYFNIIR
jgi:gliding motility-associated-like protein